MGQIHSSFVHLFLNEIIKNDTVSINYILSTTKTIIQDVSTAANAIGFSLIIIALIKDKMIRKFNFFTIFSFVLMGGVELFLRTQIGYLEINIYHTLVEIVALIYFCVIIALIRRK